MSAACVQNADGVLSAIPYTCSIFKPYPSPPQGLVHELSERCCLLGPGEAPAKCGVEERAVSLEAIGALNTALEAVPDYNQPTLLHAVRSVARGPGGEPVRLAEILSPRHVGRPTAFISHMYGACYGPCCKPHSCTISEQRFVRRPIP